MITRNQIIRRADDDRVPAPTVERDYILTHVLAAIVERDQSRQIVFKGGTALRLCYFEDYRYSADLDFSLIGGLDRAGAFNVIGEALSDCQQSLGLSRLCLTDMTRPRIEYEGPLRRSRTLKLDVADDELVEETTRRPVFIRYSDQTEGNCLVYTLDETAAEKLRCVIQRRQCRDLYDIYELFVVHDVDPSFIWPLFERKTRHRRLDPSQFSARFEQREPQYKARWTNELAVHVSAWSGAPESRKRSPDPRQAAVSASARSGSGYKAIVRLVTQRAILSWVTCPGSDDFDRASVYGQVLRLPGGMRRHMVRTSSPSNWAAPKPGTYAMANVIWE